MVEIASRQQGVFEPGDHGSTFAGSPLACAAGLASCQVLADPELQGAVRAKGARLLEEGIALRASDIDVVYTSGYGFPRYRGGPMFYADTVGLKKVYERILEFGRTLDARYWSPAPLLEKLALAGSSFAAWQAGRGD